MMKDLPDWIVELESEDLECIKKFVLNGFLKLSYPTVRIRLDR